MDTKLYFTYAEYEDPEAERNALNAAEGMDAGFSMKGAVSRYPVGEDENGFWIDYIDDGLNLGL